MKLKNSLILPMLMIFLIVIGDSDIGVSQLGDFDVFLQPGASPSSLGDAYTATATDPYATYYNPAGVAHSIYKHQFLINIQRFPRLDWASQSGVIQNQTIFLGRSLKVTDNLGAAITYSTFGMEFNSSSFNFIRNSLRFALGYRFGKKLSIGLGAARSTLVTPGLGAKQNSMAYSFGLMLQNLNIHPEVGSDTSGVAFGFSFSGISKGVHFKTTSNSTFIGGTEESDDPHPAAARMGASTIVVNTDHLIIRTSFDIRKVFFKINDDDFDKWLTPFFTGWDAKEATYHFGMEFKVPRLNFAFRMGKSIEEQDNPKVERINFGFTIWYKSLEFITTTGYSDLYLLDADEAIEGSRSNFELRYGIR